MSENEVVLTDSLSGRILAQDFAAPAEAYAAQAKADSTRRAYASDWRLFSQWCARRGVQPMPASEGSVLGFLIESAEVAKVATLQRRLSAIREAHRLAGVPLRLESIAFRDAWKGIRRTHGHPALQKAAILTTELRRALATLPNNLKGKRDRALLLIGFAGALRRSELANLEVCRRDGASGWIEQTPDGLLLSLAHSKTDQQSVGDTVAVPYGSDPATCPVRAYQAWLVASGIVAGPVFRPVSRHGRIAAAAISDKVVAAVLKHALYAVAMADGLSREQAEERVMRYSGHSLRAGLATSAAANDCPGHSIQRQLRHRKFDTTARYIRAGEIFKQNAAAMVGL